MERGCSIGRDDERFGLVASYAAVARVVGSARVEKPRAWIARCDTTHVYESNEVDRCEDAGGRSELTNAGKRWFSLVKEMARFHIEWQMFCKSVLLLGVPRRS